MTITEVTEMNEATTTFDTKQVATLEIERYLDNLRGLYLFTYDDGRDFESELMYIGIIVDVDMTNHGGGVHVYCYNPCIPLDTGIAYVFRATELIKKIRDGTVRLFADYETWLMALKHIQWPHPYLQPDPDSIALLERTSSEQRVKQ